MEFGNALGSPADAKGRIQPDREEPGLQGGSPGPVTRLRRARETEASGYVSGTPGKSGQGPEPAKIDFRDDPLGVGDGARGVGEPDQGEERDDETGDDDDEEKETVAGRGSARGGRSEGKPRSIGSQRSKMSGDSAPARASFQSEEGSRGERLSQPEVRRMQVARHAR